MNMSEVSAAPASISVVMIKSVPEMVSSGVHSRVAKGEDYHSAQCEGSRGMFAVFDSHGGKDAGKICSEEMPAKLLNVTDKAIVGLDAFPDAGLDSSFWEMDHRLGKNDIFSGTTASVLLVSAAPPDSPNSLCCKLVWVGDSTACVCDMSGDSAKAVPIICQTRDHNPDNAAEVTRCETEWRVRHELKDIQAASRRNQQEDSYRRHEQEEEEEEARKAAAASSWMPAWDGATTDSARDEKEAESFRMLSPGSKGSMSFYAKSRAPTIEEVRAACAKVGTKLSEGEVLSLVRALGREKRIEAPERRRSFTTPSVLQRSNTNVLKRVSDSDPSVHGPMVLAGGVMNKVSTCITRSIGDWDGSRAMIPQPEIVSFEVGHSQHLRAIVASDGVWDFLTLQAACKIARTAATPQAAATAIVDAAYWKSMAKFERLKDDTTCVVIDLNPSQLPFAKPADAGGCCALM